MPDLPSRIFPGETVAGHLQLTNRGEPITEPGLTRDNRAGVAVQAPDGRVVEEQELNDMGAAPDVLGGDGRYHFDLRIDGASGIFTIEGRVEGPTFERVIRHRLALARQLPFAARVITPHLAARDADAVSPDDTRQPDATDPAPAMPVPHVKLAIEQDVSLLDPAHSRLQAELRCDGTAAHGIEARLLDADTRLELPITVDTTGCRVVGTVKGQTTDGRTLDLPIDLAVDPVEPVSAPTPSETADGATGNTGKDIDGSGQGNPVMAATIGVAGLLLLLAAGWLWRAGAARRRAALIAESRS
jgi:hypothetical protein